jgi:hypothetical protein
MKLLSQCHRNSKRKQFKLEIHFLQNYRTRVKQYDVNLQQLDSASFSYHFDQNYKLRGNNHVALVLKSAKSDMF